MRIKVATVSMALEQRKARRIEDNLRYIEELMEEIKDVKPDIVALPEVFPYAGIPLKAREVEKTDAIKDFMSEMANRYKVYLAGSIYDRRNGKVFNTCFLFSRRGEIIGKYDKIHPTEPEMEEGVVPGSEEQEPIETEFGIIGFQICFDANWSMGWRKLVEKGAKMIIFSSAYPAGRILNSLALLNNVFIVASTWELKSGIIDVMGRWLVRTDRFSPWVWRDIELEVGVFHLDFQESKPKEIREKYGDKVRVETFGEEALFTIEPRSEELRMEAIIKEFSLVPYRDYLLRAEGKQKEKRESYS
ncbi:MAG: carbon-nitrogen hydrolase family protein [bacterium]